MNAIATMIVPMVQKIVMHVNNAARRVVLRKDLTASVVIKIIIIIKIPAAVSRIVQKETTHTVMSVNCCALTSVSVRAISHRRAKENQKLAVAKSIAHQVTHMERPATNAVMKNVFEKDTIPHHVKEI